MILTLGCPYHINSSNSIKMVCLHMQQQLDIFQALYYECKTHSTQLKFEGHKISNIYICLKRKSVPTKILLDSTKLALSVTEVKQYCWHRMAHNNYVLQWLLLIAQHGQLSSKLLSVSIYQNPKLQYYLIYLEMQVMQVSYTSNKTVISILKFYIVVQSLSLQ